MTSERQKRLYIFVGYPGAGKTTVSQMIATKTGAVHIWADQERQAMFGKAKLSTNETNELYKKLNHETEELLDNGKSVIFDTNFNFYKDRAYLRALAKKHGAELLLIWIKTPLDVAQARATENDGDCQTRVWGNMSLEDFERISNNLEAPTNAEQPVIFESGDITEVDVAERLSI